MRILVIAPYVPLSRMGHAGGLVTYHMVRGLSAHCEVDCLCWGDEADRQALHDDPIRANVRRVLPRALGPLRSSLLAVRCLLREPVATFALLSEMVVAHLRNDPYFGHLTILTALTVVEANRLITSGRYDVVHVEHSALISIGRFLRHPAKVLLFVDVFQMIVGRQQIPSRARQSAIRIERRGAACYRGFVTLSRKDREFVESATHKPVLAMAPWVDAPSRMVERTVAPNTMLFLGALDRDVNADAARFLVREVLPLVRLRIPNATLVIAGAHPPDDLRAEAVADPEHLVVTGFVPDIAPCFLSAHVFACPLFVGGGIIVKMLTAMAYAVPIVASAIAAEGTDARAGEHYLLAESAEEFAAQITKVLEDEELARTLGDNARRFFQQRHNWGRSIEDLVRFYQRVVTPAATT